MSQNKINVEAEGSELIILIPDKKIISKKSGIYIIKCKVNNKFYIGSSCNIRRRFREYNSDFKNRKCHNPYLQNSFSKYGLHNFTFDVIEYCDIKDLIIKEKYYIENLKPEYNIDYEIVSNRDSVKSQHYIEKRREVMKKTKDKYGEISLLRKTPFHGEFAGASKLKEVEVLEIIELINIGYDDATIASKYNVLRETISSIRRGRNWKHLNHLVLIKSSNKKLSILK